MANLSALVTSDLIHRFSIELHCRALRLDGIAIGPILLVREVCQDFEGGVRVSDHILHMSEFAIRPLRTKTDRVVRANLSFLMIEVRTVDKACFAEPSLIIRALLLLLHVPHHSNDTLCCI